MLDRIVRTGNRWTRRSISCQPIKIVTSRITPQSIGIRRIRSRWRTLREKYSRSLYTHHHHHHQPPLNTHTTLHKNLFTCLFYRNKAKNNNNNGGVWISCVCVCVCLVQTTPVLRSGICIRKVKNDHFDLHEVERRKLYSREKHTSVPYSLFVRYALTVMRCGISPPNLIGRDGNTSKNNFCLRSIFCFLSFGCRNLF